MPTLPPESPRHGTAHAEWGEASKEDGPYSSLSRESAVQGDVARLGANRIGGVRAGPLRTTDVLLEDVSNTSSVGTTEQNGFNKPPDVADTGEVVLTRTTAARVIRGGGNTRIATWGE